ncbi:MAG: hypothetical protein QG657_5352 [Acidobacteriota bacterium]|nr:hypothetical protein [Acidobacteriota bacterium]
MFKNKIISVYIAVVDFLSFSPNLHKLRRRLDRSLTRPGRIQIYPDSHPRGFIKIFRKRRITIVEAYLKIIGYLESDKYKERLAALELLVDQILSSRALEMPLNTARVQLALMKEAVKNKDNKRIQLERLRDFSLSSYGQPRLIRKFLDDLNIIEVPETGQPLKDLDMGWDPHVHDNSSYGRKTPTQLVIDAFIKGISRITVVYNSLSHMEIMFEAIEAGRILEINVDIGLEFSVGERGKRFFYIYQLPHFPTKEAFKEFIRVHREDLDIFIKGLEKIQENRIQSIQNLIKNFNTSFLAKINQGFPDEPIYNLEKLSPGDIDRVIPIKHATHIHLGELLYNKLKPVFFNRVLYLKSRAKLARDHCKAGLISKWEYRNIEKKYQEIRLQYTELEPEKLRREYFSNPELQEYNSVFKNLGDIFKAIKDESLLNGHIKIIHPLEHGLQEAVRTILENRRYIRFVEIYNMHDSIDSDHNELLLFTRFIHLLNTGDTQRLPVFLEGQSINVDPQVLPGVAGDGDQVKLVPTCGSDSTGRTSYIPGMGFVFRKALLKKQYHRNYLKNHHTLPQFVSEMIAGDGETSLTVLAGQASLASLPFDPGDAIISMGKSTQTRPNEIGDESLLQPAPLRRVWRYVNPVIKNILYIIIGFIPAYLQVKWHFALAWFAITTIRHVITDIISGRGYSPKEWHIRNIYFDNIAHSLFWTGFSVPLLALVKSRFDFLYPLAQTGMIYEFSKFFFICIVNGAYISGHNTLRGFDKTTARINFFRSLLAWPFAALFAPAGNLLAIPSIVQAKIWSDIVAGLIEGSGKFKLRFNLRKRDLLGLLPNIRSHHIEQKYTALLDLLYFFRKDPRTKNSLKAILFNRQTMNVNVNVNAKQDKQEQSIDDYFELLDWFSDSANFFKLTDFILTHYQPEQALFLADLVADKFTDFHKWLLKNKRVNSLF